MPSWRWLGIIAPAVTFISVFVSICLCPGFSWTDNALSDLGVGDGHSVVFNTGLIAGGLLVLAFSAGLLRESSGEMRAAGRLASPIGPLLACVGVFSERFGTVHLIFSVLYFLSLAVAFVGSAVVLRHSGRTAACLLAIAAAAALSWLLPVLGFVRGVAIPEVISSAAGGIWLAYLALRPGWYGPDSRQKGLNREEGDCFPQQK